MLDRITSIQYLIGGCPAGATSFTASYLSAAGYKTSHEKIYHSNGSLSYIHDGTYDCLAEVNYTVCDWMHLEPVSALPVILIMRNPFHVLNSLVSREFRLGKSVNPDEVMLSIMERYNRYLNNERAIRIFRIEHDINSLCEFLGIQPLSDSSNLFSRHHNHNVINLREQELIKYSQYQSFKQFTDKYYDSSKTEI